MRRKDGSRAWLSGKIIEFVIIEVLITMSIFEFELSQTILSLHSLLRRFYIPPMLKSRIKMFQI